MSLYILGDSHVNIYRHLDINTFYSNVSIHHTDCENVVRHGKFIPYLMNSIAQRGTELLKPYITHIMPNSHIMFIFGEPDCRIHIHNQIHKYGRSQDEVIKTLALEYINMIKHITSLTNTIGIVRYVLPPIDKDVWNNESYKPNGTINERVSYTRKLNTILSELCPSAGLYFIDNIHYTTVTLENGSLNPYYADEETHYNTHALQFLNEELHTFYKTTKLTR